jgi:hypothetical protein
VESTPEAWEDSKDALEVEVVTCSSKEEKQVVEERSKRSLRRFV